VSIIGFVEIWPITGKQGRRRRRRRCWRRRMAPVQKTSRILKTALFMV
jgi:hypothetical protein